MNLIEQLKWRYATKRMNGQPLSEEKIKTILEAIRLAPTSMGLQAFQVIVIEDKELREQIFNQACPQPQIKESAAILIFAANTTVTEAQVDQYMQLIVAERGVTIESLADFKAMFMPIVAFPAEKQFAWTARQTYIALGVGLVAAASEQVDATPMEGFNNEAMDKLLHLTERGLSAVTVMALGYRDEAADYLAQAKKVRKSEEDLYITLP